jgi:hypothetical protein
MYIWTVLVRKTRLPVVTFPNPLRWRFWESAWLAWVLCAAGNAFDLASSPNENGGLLAAVFRHQKRIKTNANTPHVPA